MAPWEQNCFWVLGFHSLASKKDICIMCIWVKQKLTLQLMKANVLAEDFQLYLHLSHVCGDREVLLR